MMTASMNRGCSDGLGCRQQWVSRRRAWGRCGTHRAAVPELHVAQQQRALGRAAAQRRAAEPPLLCDRRVDIAGVELLVGQPSRQHRHVVALELRLREVGATLLEVRARPQLDRAVLLAHRPRGDVAHEGLERRFRVGAVAAVRSSSAAMAGQQGRGHGARLGQDSLHWLPARPR